MFMKGTLDTYKICCYSTVPLEWHFNNQHLGTLNINIVKEDSYYCLEGHLLHVKEGAYKCSGLDENEDYFVAEKYILLKGIFFQRKNEVLQHGNIQLRIDIANVNSMHVISCVPIYIFLCNLLFCSCV